MPRPHITCHMCATLDAKILGHRWSRLPNGKPLANLFEPTALKLHIPAWLVGTTTMKEFAGHPQKLTPPKSPVPPGDFIANPTAKSFAIGTDAKAILRFQNPEILGDHVILLITQKASPAYRAHLRHAGVSYLLAGKSHINLPLALQKLHDKFNLKKLMLHGGGTFNAAMLKAKLIDELSLILCPILDGGGPSITSLFNLAGPPTKSAAAQLHQTHHKILPHNAHWFRYRLQY